jgi:hypothetical protein
MADTDAMFDTSEPSMSQRIARFKVRLDGDECRAERAAHSVYEAVADFTVAIHDARTIAEARRIWTLLGPLVSVMESTERAALLRTETLNP